MLSLCMEKICLWCYKEIKEDDNLYRFSKGVAKSGEDFDLDINNPAQYMHRNCMEDMEMQLKRSVITDFEQ